MSLLMCVAFLRIIATDYLCKVYIRFIQRALLVDAIIMPLANCGESAIIHSMKCATRNADEVKAWLDRHGVTIHEWAHAHAFTPGVVYALLQGRTRGLRGEAHQVAIALGMKPAPALSELSPLTVEAPDEKVSAGVDKDTVRTHTAIRRPPMP